MKNLEYAKLISYNRINGSNMGNPNYEVVLEDGNGEYIYTRSSSNTSWCYSISYQWVGKSVAYHTTKSRRIDYMKKLELTDIFVDPIFNAMQ